MWIGFADGDGYVEHDAFQKWRLRHRGGFVLRFTAKHRAYLHRVHCPHFGKANRMFQIGGHSLTSHLKVCHESEKPLRTWAGRFGVKVIECSHCLRPEAEPKPAG